MSALYTYDDPRITYDEMCFFYDGGFDLLCLKEKAQKVYGRLTKKDREKEPKEEIFNLFIRISLVEVNGEEVDEPLSEKIFRFTDEPDLIKIKVAELGVSIDMTQPFFSSDYVGITRDAPEKVEAVLDDVKTAEVQKNIVVVEVPGEKENNDIDILVSLIDVKE